MGSSMAGHLLAAGYPVNVYNRSKDKTNALVEKGAKWFDAVGELAANSKVIITMVGYPSDVEEITLVLERSWIEQAMPISLI